MIILGRCLFLENIAPLANGSVKLGSVIWVNTLKFTQTSQIFLESDNWSLFWAKQVFKMFNLLTFSNATMKFIWNVAHHTYMHITLLYSKQ